MVKCNVGWPATSCFILVLYFKTRHDTTSASGIKRFYANKIDLILPLLPLTIINQRLEPFSDVF
jgi:hypothetical protein